MTDREDILIWRAFAAFALPIAFYVVASIASAVWLYATGQL